MCGGRIFNKPTLVTQDSHVQRVSNSLTASILPPRVCGFPDLLARVSSLPVGQHHTLRGLPVWEERERGESLCNSFN